jgi:O-antigen/teichoic acid export membrane protein
MPEPSPHTSQIIALAVLVSAISLGVVALLIFSGTIPIAEDTRPMIALAVGVAAFADLMVAIWFFRKGQSS